MKTEQENIILLIRFGLGSRRIAEILKIDHDKVAKIVSEEYDRRLKDAKNDC